MSLNGRNVKRSVIFTIVYPKCGLDYVSAIKKTADIVLAL